MRALVTSLLVVIFCVVCLTTSSASESDPLQCLNPDSSECRYTLYPRGTRPELDKSLNPMEAFRTLVDKPQTLNQNEWNLPSLFGEHFGAVYMPKFDLPVEYNPIVADSIDYFSRRAKSSFGRFLSRSGKYVPMMREIFDEEGAPMDLVYLSLIESGYSPTALSSAKACGLWQFMARTGQLYGLDQTDWIDERMDFEKSTRAAARHLKDLYDDFGDWSLSLAAYNAGIGKVSRAVKNSGKTDFWDIIKEGRHLKLETVNYVPKFYAALLISKSPERFGFDNLQTDSPLDYEQVITPPLTSLKKVAAVSGASFSELEELNPELLRSHTPPDSSGYYLKVPRTKAEGLEDKLAALSPYERHDFKNHRVKEGQTLSSIARHYKLTQSKLAMANGMIEPRALKTGMVLIIPPSGSTEKNKSVSNYAGTPITKGGKIRAVYKVKQKDTLWGIASRADVKLADLEKWNGLKAETPIYPGDEIVLYLSKSSQLKKVGAYKSGKRDLKRRGSKVKYHEVLSGETLWSISRKYGVSVNDICKWNDINVKKHILKPGQKLKIK